MHNHSSKVHIINKHSSVTIRIRIISARSCVMVVIVMMRMMMIATELDRIKACAWKMLMLYAMIHV